MLKAIKKLFQPAPQKYHWYEIRYIYRKDGRELFNFTRQVGFVEQEDVLFDREIKLIIGPLHKQKALQKLLCNGVGVVERVSYIGYFKQLSQTK